VVGGHISIRGSHITQALADSGRLQAFAQPKLSLLLTGIVAIAILVIADLKIIRPALRVPLQRDFA
jgi:hypothetical protein